MGASGARGTYPAPRATRPTLYVKIGAMPGRRLEQIRRAPKGAWYKVVRAAPKMGDTFAVRDEGDAVVLRCTEVRSVVGGATLYLAEKV